jgi:hypothetical protein
MTVRGPAGNWTWTKSKNQAICHDVWKNVPCTVPIMLQESDSLKGLGMDGRIVLQWILNNWDGKA